MLANKSELVREDPRKLHCLSSHHTCSQFFGFATKSQPRRFIGGVILDTRSQ